MENRAEFDTPALIDPEGLQQLIHALARRGYEVIGPVRRDDAITYAPIDDLGDLPSGWRDRQAPGRYALERRADDALFGFNVGPHSWKRYLHPPEERVWSATCDPDGLVTPAIDDDRSPPRAFIGARACELRAIEIQDAVLCEGETPDPGYARHREDAFIVAVNCSDAGETCFCVSMEAGPRARSGFDLALTEMVEGDRHQFLVEIGSPAGADMLAEIPHRTANAAAREKAGAVIARTAASMGRKLETKGLKERLQKNPELQHWDDVAARCLSCGNCTMVCPTCFCTTFEDTSDFANRTAERVRKWDSCFSLDFSYVHGGSLRHSTRSRYRQWLTHKLANWIDQFGTSGCVGCGRCITWCPVGIDITVEAGALREDASLHA